MGVLAVATPPKGITDNYQDSRTVRFKDDGSPYSPNCEIWYPGFLYPFVCGREANDVYKEALKQVGSYLPFNSLKHRDECAALLEEELRKFGLVNTATGKIDPHAFQDFICRSQEPQNDEEKYDA